jgi:bifunctional DNA-binding transcriptional regulator/antitoxin component of YhaV-PrlF toxin-antitoxin module
MHSGNKPLKSKIVKRSGAESVIVTIPTTIRYIMDLNPGDDLEFYPLKDGRVCIRKAIPEESTIRAQNEKK